MRLTSKLNKKWKKVKFSKKDRGLRNFFAKLKKNQSHNHTFIDVLRLTLKFGVTAKWGTVHFVCRLTLALRAGLQMMMRCHPVGPAMMR